MEYELSDAGPSRKSLLLKFDIADVNKAFDASYREINKVVRVKGFRQGKAPLRILRGKYEDDARRQARQELINDNFRQTVVEKENLQLLGDIMIKNHTVYPEEGKAYELQSEFDVRPDFELPVYTGLDIDEQGVDVTEEQVEEKLQSYRRMFANYEEIDEAAAVSDVLRVDFEAKVDGEEIMSMDDQRLRVEGETLFGLPCPELVEKFTGAKKGDFVELKIKLPEDHPNPELRGRDATVEVTVKSVERGALPELNDEFAQGIGMGTMANFRERVRGGLMQEAFVSARQKEEDQIINKLLDQVDFTVPQGMVDAEANALVEQRRMQLIRTGVNQGEAMTVQLGKYREEAEKEAERKVRWTLLSQKIAEKEGIKVSNDDMVAQVEALAQTYNTTPAKIVQRIREFNGVEPMMAEILSLKVVQFLSSNSKGGVKAIATEAVNAEAARIATGGAAKTEEADAEGKAD